MDRDKARKLPAVRDQQGSLVHREPIETTFKGKRVRVVGDKLAVAPPERTDQEHYVDFLRDQLGDDWNQEQRALPESNRHVLHRWNTEWDALRSGAAQPGYQALGNKQNSASATGNLNCLINLAHDVTTLADAMVLPEELVKKLRTVDQFQGARYEIAMAAVLLRAQFEIEWIPREDRKRPEFNATNRHTGQKVAVEAKSRHREGVLGRQGEMPEEVKVDVSNLMAKALKKETDGLPFLICIDLNMPTAAPESFSEWAKELEAGVLGRFSAGGQSDPDPWAAVAFTNYSWQWDGDNVAGDPLSCVAIPHHSVNPLPHSELDLITQAISQYGEVTRRPKPNSGARAA